MACSLLDKELKADCDKPLTAGTHETMLLINPSEIASITYDLTHSNVITDITMKSTKKAYAWVGIKQSNNPSVTLVEGEYQNKFEHKIEGLVFNTSYEDDKVLQDLAIGNAPLIAIIHKRDHGDGGKRAFRVYGNHAYLYLRALTQVVNDNANLGAWQFTLQTLDSGSSILPEAFFDTDYATTLAAFEALTTPAP